MGLRELNLIELPKPKRPEEASRFEEPNFCHFHRILGHTLKDCFVVKNIIQKMIDDETIDGKLLKSFKGKKVETTNIATIQNDRVSCEPTNMGSTCYQNMLMLEPEFVNMPFSGYTRQQAKRKYEGKTLLRRNPTPKGWSSAPRRSRERQQQLGGGFLL